jgi:ketosteroid isomerase-like protein
MTTTTPGRKFYEEQLNYLFAKDVDGLIDNHYNEDALLVSVDFVVKGRDALKKHFRNYLAMLGNLEVKSTDKFQETEDTAILEASVVSDLGPAHVYDSWVLKNGKIAYHFTGVK